MNNYGYFDIYFTDQEDRSKETIIEQLSLKSEKEAKRVAESWQKMTWTDGRRYGYRASKIEAQA